MSVTEDVSNLKNIISSILVLKKFSKLLFVFSSKKESLNEAEEEKNMAIFYNNYFRNKIRIPYNKYYFNKVHLFKLYKNDEALFTLMTNEHVVEKDIIEKKESDI